MSLLGLATCSWQSQLLNQILRMQRVNLQHRGHVQTLRRRVKRLDDWHGRWLSRQIHHESVCLDGVSTDLIKGHADGTHHLLYLHGGAFCMHSPWLYRGFVAELCRELGCAGWIPNYRLAPEHPFPAGLQDCLAAYRSLLHSGIAPARIVLAGDSAGGQLALSMLALAAWEGLSMPSCVALISTGGDWTLSGPSFTANAHRDAMFEVKTLSYLREIYLDETDPADPFASPVHARFKDFPPVHLVASRDELMRDISQSLANRIRAAGGTAELRLWDGMCHAFPLFSFLPESRRARGEIVSFIRRHIGRAPPAPPLTPGGGASGHSENAKERADAANPSIAMAS
jgi:epsilon-lactone hydrolase